MGISGMGEPGSPLDPDPGASSSASETSRSSTPLQRGELQSVRTRVAHLLSTTRIAWVWGAHGLLGALIGLLLLSQFGAALGPTRVILGVWVLLTAAATAWRWHLDGRRSLYLLIASAIGLVAGVLVLVGGGFSLLVTMWAIGLFWVAAGLLELFAWFQSRGPAVQWPWVSGLILLVGVVMVTLPKPLVPILTVLGSAWAIMLGLVHLLGWLWLSRHAGKLGMPTHRPSLLRRILLVGIPAVLLAVPVLVTSATENARQRSLDEFYQVPSHLAAGAPGSIVRIESLSTPGVDGRGWRILFRSQDQHGRVTVTSGVVYAPASAGSNRLVVAWAHGTIGLAPNCAPSRQVVDNTISPWLNQMLDRGWVVTAPDYVGAGGTGGPGVTEQYLIGAEQGRDLLNSVRAARNIPEAGIRFALYGHSQGGLVALFGAALAPTYMPELTLVAVGAVSAASDPGGILRQIWNSPLAGWILGPNVMYPWIRYYPNLDASAILSPAGLNHYQEMALTNCITDILPAVINPQMGDFLSKDPNTDPAWRRAFVANQAPLVPKGIPAFIGHGLADTLINPAFSAWLVTRYCANGTAVATDWLSGVGHGDAAIQAAPQYIQWLAGIVAGQQPPSDCGKPLPVPPAQPITA